MKAVIAAVLALLCASASARAQPAGDLAGAIYDQTGAPLPGVRVAIRGVTNRRAETSVAGEFVFNNLPEGDYEISVELSAFERQGRAVRVRAGERATMSFTLRVAAAAQTIVTAAKAGGRMVTQSGMVLDGTLDRLEGPPSVRADEDPDKDGIANEIPRSLVDYLEFYLLNYFKPATYRITQNVRKMMRSRSGNGPPASTARGTARAAASETAPRMPDHEITSACESGAGEPIRAMTSRGR